MSKVTVIIPSYNQQEFLADAIDSALTQTYECEIIVIDDGSTDNSLAMAKSYEPRVKVISQLNKGLSAARNTGIMNATGEYIMPLDADDILEDTCVEKLLEMAEQENADIVAPSFKAFGINDGIVELIPNPALDDFKLGNRIGYFSLLRKSKLLEVGGYSPKMNWGWEDLHLTINLLHRGAKLITTKDILVLYRTKARSMIHEANEHSDELTKQLMKDFPNFYV